MDEERTSLVSRAFLVAGLLMSAGCATNGDLEALRTHVNNSLLQSRQQMQNRLGGLEDTKKKIDAQEKQLTARQAQESRLDVLESAVKRSLDQQLLLSDDVATVRMAVQDQDDALLLLLDAQEQVYQESVRTLQAIRKQLAGQQSHMRSPRSQAPESSGTMPTQSDSLEKSDLRRPKR